MKTKIIKISDTKICPNGHKNCLSAKCYIDKPKKEKEIMEDIKKGNTILAEFMGYINITPTDKDFNIYKNNEGKMLEVMSMTYHTDWNCLKEVLKKIREVAPIMTIDETTEEEDFIYRIFRLTIFEDIKVVWQYAVKFAEWHLKKKNK